jgi:hypothetical protein
MFNSTNTKAKRWALGGQQSWQNSSHVGERINANGKDLWPPWGQPQWHVSYDTHNDGRTDSSCFAWPSLCTIHQIPPSYKDQDGMLLHRYGLHTLSCIFRCCSVCDPNLSLQTCSPNAAYSLRLSQLEDWDKP